MPFNFHLTRTLWFSCHVYMALIFGLFFSILGLTGSLSVYREEIDTFLNSDLRIEAESDQTLSLDKIFAQIKKSHPNRHGAWTLEMPSAANRVITAWFENPKESVDQFYAPLMVAVNPYTGQVIKSRFWGDTLTTWILDLHTHLHFGTSGRTMVASLAGLLSLSILSGLYLWWPGLQHLAQILRIRQRAGLMTLLMDSHRLLGSISAIGLLLLAFTGFHLAYPALLESLTDSSGMGHGDEGPTVRSTAIPNNKPISIEEAVLVARGLFPSSEVRRITTPAGELGTYRINLRQKQELNQHHPFTSVWVDRWSGQIRAVNNPSQFSAGQTFTTWQWPLHTGEAFGETGRLLTFMAGFTPLILWLSGLTHWLYRKNIIQDRTIDLGALTRAGYQRVLKLSMRMQRSLLNALQPLIIIVIRRVAEFIDRRNS